MTTLNQKEDKIDKRAAALRDNLKRRKAKAKADKKQNKESEKKNGFSKNEFDNKNKMYRILRCRSLPSCFSRLFVVIISLA